jgi:hypothetical protein
MNNLIKINTGLVKADAFIQVANKLLAITSNLPELIPYRKGDKWGFCDRNKKIIIACIYDWVDFFYDGYALVEFDGKYNYIDNSNEPLFDLPLDVAQRFSEGLAFVRNKNVNGFINTNGEVVIPIEGMYALDFKNSIATVYENLSGNPADYFAKIIDKYGRTLWDITPGSTGHYPEYFSEGFYIFVNTEYVYDYNYSDYYFKSFDGKIELNGHRIINGYKYRGFDTARPFSEGFSAVRLTGNIFPDGKETSHWYYMDRAGTLKLGTFVECGNFSCGLAPVKKGYSDTWGYINATGEMAIPAKFTFASDFINDLGVVAEENDVSPFAIINRVGDVVLHLNDMMVSKDYRRNRYWSYLQVEERTKMNDYYGGYLKYRFEKSLFQYLRQDGRICAIDIKGNKYWED